MNNRASNRNDGLSRRPYTIDLHGYKKSEAIRLLTQFLEEVKTKSSRTSSMALVITGSGRHSQQGAVLRSQVEAIFQRRQMKYSWGDPGKGSFLVDARSGFTLYEPEQPRDTKVVITDEERILNGRKSNNKTMAMRVRETLPHQAPLRLTKDELPLPSEVAASDAFIEESRTEAQRMRRDMLKEEKGLQKAMSLSLLEVKREEEEDQEMMNRAMSLSMMKTSQAAKEDEDYERSLQEAIDLSEIAANQEIQEAAKEDEDLQKILELSKKEHVQNNEIDGDLARILEHSKLHF